MVEAIGAELPNEAQRHALRARVSAALKLVMALYGPVPPDELVANCISTALREIRGMS
jgi:hypothetical protein